MVDPSPASSKSLSLSGEPATLSQFGAQGSRSSSCSRQGSFPPSRSSLGERRRERNRAFYRPCSVTITFTKSR
jgi:hypothetical protein